ncbi:MAG: rhomboid family intramembrane serine protease [Candidatus Sumerlaeia bacterium]|nr:rhomboid family intramembrane serine protease [Candidatus Sumerlaeia bacterium]
MNGRSLIPTGSVFDPRIFFTVTLLVIQASLLVAIGVAGGGFLAADPQALIRYGALVRPRVWDDGEYWRLLTAMFLHSDIFHLALNGICLLYFGGYVEMMLGRMRFLLLYFASGLFASLLSLVMGKPLAICIGASGAIFGVVVAYLMVRVRGPDPWTQVMRERASRLLFFLIGLQLAVGFLIPQIDAMAHVGGALTGLTLGYFLVSQWQPLAVGWRFRPVAALGLWLGAALALSVQAARPPDGPTYHVAAALYYLGENRARSLAHFDRAVAADAARAVARLDRMVPRSQLKPYVIATFLEYLDDPAPAIEFYQTRAARNASADDLWLLISLLQRPDVADYDAALAVCADGRKRFPDMLRWDLLEARVHAHFRRFEAALERLDQTAATSLPLTAAYWEIRAHCYVRRGQWVEADEATSRCLAAPPSGMEDVQLRAPNYVIADWRYLTLRRLGRTTEALALWDEMEKHWRADYLRNPDDPVGANNLAWFLATHPRAESDTTSAPVRATTVPLAAELEEALLLARWSVEAAPEAYNLDTLAWIEHLRGNHEAAWQAMSQALRRRASARPEYHYHAGAILAALGKNEEAIAFLQHAIQRGVDFDEYGEAEALLQRLESAAAGAKNMTRATPISAARAMLVSI